MDLKKKINKKATKEVIKHNSGLVVAVVSVVSVISYLAGLLTGLFIKKSD